MAAIGGPGDKSAFSESLQALLAHQARNASASAEVAPMKEFITQTRGAIGSAALGECVADFLSQNLVLHTPDPFMGMVVKTTATDFQGCAHFYHSEWVLGIGAKALDHKVPLGGS